MSSPKSNLLFPIDNYRFLIFLVSLTSLLAMSACNAPPRGNSTANPALVTQHPSLTAFETLAAVTSSDPPPRDMVRLAALLKGIEAPRLARTQPIEYVTGDVVTFWVKNMRTDENYQIQATLAYRSNELNLWFQAGESESDEALHEAAHFIETQILPVNRAFFGYEWRPGIDGDDRINILHLRDIDGAVAAYYWSADEYVTAVNPFSNQREMLYVSLRNAPVGSDAYYIAIAHEMQHLINWYNDTNEEAWLNEGLSELAGHINGFHTRRAGSYVARTDTQLNTLSQEPDVISAHYGAATLFSIYFLDRFGEDATRALVRHPDNGIDGFTQLLADMDAGITFDDLFADWLVASFLEGLGRGQGAYQYRTVEMPAIKPQLIERFPAVEKATVSQFGADFIQLQSDSPLTVVFTGTQQVALVDARPHSGEHYWISSPADESDMHLTRAFDLTRMPSATLSFWSWYDIEEGWDYGYVSVSADGGDTWDLLETASTTRANPQGNSFGPGFTGISGGGNKPTWMHETAELSPYAGRSVLIRFQYVTDGAVHEQGFLIDDISIPELGYFDDIESGDGDWEAAGFARVGQYLPQSYIVQLILLGDNEQEIRRLPLDENQQGRWLIPLDKRHNEAILIIAGSTPVTRNLAAYEYEIVR